MHEKPLAVGTVKEAWEGTVPEWVMTLAKEVDARGSQKLVGEAIGYSAACVNQVLKCKYRGNMEKVERAVRAALMHETVKCPVIGEMFRTVCVETQRRPFSAASAQSVRLYQACRTCANNGNQ